MGVPKLSQVGVPGLWTPISLECRVRSRCGLNQSCSSRRELSNAVSHSQIWHREGVDSRLLVVGSQTANLTPGLSFAHNLCFRCPNEQCEPILDIYVPRAFQWYQERNNPLRFDPSTRPLKFRESTGTPSPKLGVALGMWGLTPSHSPTLSYIPGSVWWLPGFLLARNLPMPLLSLSGFLPFWLATLPCFCLDSRASFLLGPQPCNPFALVASPKLGLRQLTNMEGSLN
jgi:hypothetical protein